MFPEPVKQGPRGKRGSALLTLPTFQPGEPPAPQHQPICDFGISQSGSGVSVRKGRDGGALQSLSSRVRPPSRHPS